MGRNRTELRHVTSDGQKVRVTEENGEFFIGNSNERAEGKMAHFRSVQHINGKATSNYEPGNKAPHQINNPFYGSGQGEWDDYAHTSDDL